MGVVFDPFVFVDETGEVIGAREFAGFGLNNGAFFGGSMGFGFCDADGWLRSEGKEI